MKKEILLWYDGRNIEMDVTLDNYHGTHWYSVALEL